MADCNDLFEEFLEKVTIKKIQKDSLRISRDAIRGRIRDHFKEELGVKMPKFHGQGSFMMGTMLNPLNGEYDIDDGIYLQHLGEDDEEWPTPQTVHKWVVNAVTGCTSTPPVDKNTCVRVIYANKYHVDLPIYAIKEELPYLAEKSKGWQPSDPKAFTDWFIDQVKDEGEQLRSVVKYLKAWCDFQNGATKMPSGIVITILASENFYSSEGRDDSALIGTARNILDKLNSSFSVTKPVEGYDELIANWSDTRKNNFLSKLEKLCDKGTVSLQSKDKKLASEKWIELLGDRFPLYTPPKGKETNALKTSAPAVLGNHERSA